MHSAERLLAPGSARACGERVYMKRSGAAGNSNEVIDSIDALIDGRCASLPMVHPNQGAGIEEVTGQRSTFPSVGNNFSSHCSINLRQPTPDFFQTGADPASCRSLLTYSNAKLDLPSAGAVLATLTSTCSCSFKSNGCSGRSTPFS